MVKLSVPVPYFLTAKYWFTVGLVAEVMLLLKLMMPVPSALKISARPVPVRIVIVPPLRFRVAPLSTPIDASALNERTPVMVEEPLAPRN